MLAVAATFGAGFLFQGEASAKGRCASGQILRVSTGTCVSREAAVEQGIIGGQRKLRSGAATKVAPEQAQQALADPESDEAPATSAPRSNPASDERKPVRAARAPRPQIVSDARPVQATAASSEPGVRIQVVKTETRPTPAILTPTWPYGELSAFPKRNSP